MMIIVDALNYAFSKGGKAITLEEAIGVVEDAIRILEEAGKKDFLFVFDGYNENYAGANHMVWVGSDKKADDWIIEFVSKNKGNIKVITRDKALANRVKWINKNVVIWDPAEFDDYLNKLSKKENTKVEYTKKEPDTTAEKIEMSKNFNEKDFERGFIKYTKKEPDTTAENLEMLKNFNERKIEVDFESYVKNKETGGKKTGKSKDDTVPFENVDWEEIYSKFDELIQKLRK